MYFFVKYFFYFRESVPERGREGGREGWWGRDRERERGRGEGEKDREKEKEGEFKCGFLRWREGQAVWMWWGRGGGGKS
jgi:hypothetical protein